MRLGTLTTIALLITLGCKGHPPPIDTDKELFRTPEALTTAREVNLSKWIADYLREKRHLPISTREVLPASAGGGDSADNPLNDAWGHPIMLTSYGRGFELRSSGPDGAPNTSDDIVQRVPDPSSVR